MGRCKICTDGSLLIKAYTIRQGNLITNEETEPICGDPHLPPLHHENAGI